MQKLLKLFYKFCYFTGITQLFFMLNSRKKLIISYHNVIDDELFDHALHLGVSHSRSNFAIQMRLIKNKFKLTSDIEANTGAMITFDDGYRNNVTTAAVILNQLKIPAYFFVPLDSIGAPEPLWCDQLLLWFSYVPHGKYQLLEHIYIINKQADREKEYARLYLKLLENPELTIAVLQAMHQLIPFNTLVSEAVYAQRFQSMNIAELTQLKQAGHYVGAHSVAHEVLSRKQPHDLHHDFKRTAAAIGSIYNTTVYAYPFGGLNEISTAVFDCCAQSGFSHGLLNIFENIPKYKNKKYIIPRMTLPNTGDKYIIYAKLSGLEKFTKEMLRWK